jgi:hypothetical protein
MIHQRSKRVRGDSLSEDWSSFESWSMIVNGFTSTTVSPSVFAFQWFIVSGFSPTPDGLFDDHIFLSERTDRKRLNRWSHTNFLTDACTFNAGAVVDQFDRPRMFQRSLLQTLSKKPMDARFYERRASTETGDISSFYPAFSNRPAENWVAFESWRSEYISHVSLGKSRWFPDVKA